MNQQLKQRLLMSFLGIFLLSSAIYFSFDPFFKPIFILLHATVIGLALIEYYQLTKYCEFTPYIDLGLSCAVAYIGVLGLSLYYPVFESLPSLVLLFAFVLFFIVALRYQQKSIGNLAVTVFGFAYLVLPLGCGLKINYFFPIDSIESIHMQDGRLWFAYVLTVTKMTDMGGYIVGKITGRHLLAPRVSPNKTIEGSLGGLTASIFSSFLFYKLSQLPSISPIFQLHFWQSLILGILFNILAQLGDLGESLLKREAKIKDSSRLPGLGGALDIVDSLIFTLPLLYLLLKLHVVG